MYYTYILKSLKNNSYYIGSCHDLEKRFKKHQNGYVKSTKRYVPWQIVYKEFFKTLKEARQKERKIKSWKKRKVIEKLINRGSSTTLLGP